MGRLMFSRPNAVLILFFAIKCYIGLVVTIDHIGMGVKDLEEAVQFYSSLGFSIAKRFEKSSPKMKAAFVEKDNQRLELFEFDDWDSPETIPLQKHIGFLSDSFDADLESFLKNGYKVVISETKGTTVKKFLFLVDDSGNYSELFER